MTEDRTTEALPIACSLSAAGRAERGAEVADPARPALLGRRPIDRGVMLTFDAAAGIEPRLRALVAAEAECCPFLRMDVRRVAGGLELVVAGPDEARLLIDELFAGAGGQ